jgi:DNA replication licensing factor MCM7
MFLILDVANVDNDMALARHVTFVHKHNGTEAKQVGENGGGNSNSNIHGLNNNMEDSSDSSDSSDDENEMKDDINSNTNNNNDDEDDDDKPLDPEVVKEYISRARQHHPSVPKDVAPYIVEAYVALRKQDHDNMGQGGGGNNHAVNHNNFSSKQSNTDQTVMTARQLLSILRLSQALARLRFSDFVAREDVDEAIRLTHMSKASLLDEEEGMGGKRGEDVISKIYGIIRDYRRSVGNLRVELSVVESMVVRKGFTSEQFATCLEEYTNLNVLQVNSVRTHVDFLS